MVSPLIVTVMLPLVSNTRSFALPSMMVVSAPAPVMITLSSISSFPVVKTYVPIGTMMVSVPGAALASVMACRSDPAPASLVLVTVKVANTPSQASWVASPMATDVSMNPVATSNFQLAYSLTCPVRSVLAAISAPVSSARVWIAEKPA